MKTILKRVLLGAGIIILLIVLFFVAYGIKAKSETKKMATVESKEIIDNLFSVKDSFVNLYLINDSGRYIAIDAGNDIEKVSEELGKLSINPDDVVAVLLTHTDGDHVAAISLFKNAEVFISTQEEQLLTGEKSRFLFFGNTLNGRDYSLIEDQQTFTIGNTLVKGILTPGHTPGSMCFQINSKYLFTGDILSLKSDKIEKFNTFFNMDTKTAVESMKKIANLAEVEYVFSAHYGYTDNYPGAVEGWMH